MTCNLAARGVDWLVKLRRASMGHTGLLAGEAHNNKSEVEEKAPYSVACAQRCGKEQAE